jgi:hypothetical protein
LALLKHHRNDRLTSEKHPHFSTPFLHRGFPNEFASRREPVPAGPLTSRLAPIFSAAYRDRENYFFEWCVWLGHAIYGLAFWNSSGWIALVPQALLLVSILFVTGIPPTEAQSLRSRGDAYRAYQRRVSAFVPLPPRRVAEPRAGA